MNLPKTMLIVVFIVGTLNLFAQEDNPYKSIGKKGKVLTAYNGKFIESFDCDSIQRIGSVLFNIYTKKIVKLLLADQTFKKFSDNSAASRWWSPDPLAAKYTQWSPYVYVNDNPIRFNDPDGRELIDQNGKHVAVTFNKDGSLKFSKNANADLVRLANGMAKTEIGLKVLHSMNDSKTQISMRIDKENVVLDKNGNVKGGVTEPTISQKTINGQPVGEKYISVAKITIYEKGVQELADKYEGKISIGGTTFDTKTTPMEDIISSFGVHEGTHATDRGSSSSLNPRSTTDQTEKKPYANQLLHLQELQQSNTNSTNNE